MTLVTVERAFEVPQDHAELQAREKASAFCLDAKRVKFLRSFFSADRQHMVSLYEAPDAEAVRTTQRTAQLPVAHVWSATVVSETPFPVPAGYSLVVAQRALPPGVSLELVIQLLNSSAGCNDRLRVRHLAGYMSLDCTRMFCVYSSPDAESVRVSNRENGVPAERVWSAERIDATP
jgi:hypothetical protein